MLSIRNSRFLGRVFWPLVLVLFLGGCTKWSTLRTTPEAYLAAKAPKKMRVWQTDGTEMTLEAPFSIVSDSLVGQVFTDWGPQDQPRTAIALDDIDRIDARESNGLATTFVVIGVTAVVLAVVAAAAEDEPAPRRTTTSEPLSCPLVYSWNGEEWILDSGTFGGAIFEPLRRTDVDLLEHAQAEDGILRLRMANELVETDYVDAVSVLAIDAPPGASVAPDGNGRIHVMGSLAAPVSATDGRGRDVLERVLSRDGRAWESAVSGRDTARAADIRDGLVLGFVRPQGATSARLVVDGHNTSWASHLLKEYLRLRGRELTAWYDSLNADPGRAYATASRLAREAFLSVAVRTADGWSPQGVVWEAGPEVIKRQAHELDLTGVDGDTVWVKLESAPSYWRIDRVAIDHSSPLSFTASELTLVSALDMDGRDVLPRLRTEDRADVVLEPGDEVSLEFRVPPQPSGLERQYVLRTSGWYRLHIEGFGDPDHETIARIEQEPGAISKLSVARINDLLGYIAESR